MNEFEYVFRNSQTGELRRSAAHALVPAARAVGITVTLKLGQWDITPWMRWECWQGRKCIWHYDDAGKVTSGPRGE
jgi:hypothetical protein